MQVSARIKDSNKYQRRLTILYISIPDAGLWLQHLVFAVCAKTENTPVDFSDFMRGKQINVSHFMIFLWMCSTLWSKYIW